MNAASPLNAVVRDLASHPFEQWAIVLGDELLPIRFGRSGEAHLHLSELLKLRRDEDAREAAYVG